MSDLHETAGSYVLDALDAAELAEYEAHLATCDVCPDDIAELRETVAALSLLTMSPQPAELRGSILAAIQDAPQTVVPAPGPPAATNGSRPAETADRTVRAARAGGPRRALPGSEVSEEPRTTPPVDEIAVRRQRRRSRLLGGLVAAVLALAVGLGGVVYTLLQERRAEFAQISLEQQLYAAPDVKTSGVDLKGGGKATFVWSPQLNRALFIGSGLPDPGSDKRYQLWTMDGPEPLWKVATRVTRDVQITDRDSAVRVFFNGDIAASDWLCVSVEPKDNLTDTPTVPPAGSAKV